MRQPFFEDLMTAMYPSGLLHTFGVNGKISGSVGAVGEMQEVLPLLHSPRGCGFHYRYSARRRHQPFYSVLTSNLEERDIICGGEEKLRQAIRDAWSRYRPGLIMVIPSPISDILNEDVRSVCAELRREGISVVGVQSELFSHRDKNYTRNRLKELAHQTITGDNRLEMELKGCGFTEALYALVEQVMEPSAQIPHSINIETVGWGSEGKAALRELEEEVGVTCGRLTYLGCLYLSPGFSTEVLHMYLAQDLKQGQCHPDEDEFLESERIPFDQLFQKVMSGEIADAKTVALVLKTKQLLGL